MQSYSQTPLKLACGQSDFTAPEASFGLAQPLSTDSMDMNLSKLWQTVKDRGAWYAVVHGVTKSRTQRLNNNKASILSEGAACRLGKLWPFSHAWGPLCRERPPHSEVCKPPRGMLGGGQ